MYDGTGLRGGTRRSRGGSGCGRRRGSTIDDRSIVAGKRDKRGVLRKSGPNFAQSYFTAFELGSKGCALLGQRTFGLFGFAPRLVDEARILLGPLFAGTSDHQIGEALSGRFE